MVCIYIQQFDGREETAWGNTQIWNGYQVPSAPAGFFPLTSYGDLPTDGQIA